MILVDSCPIAFTIVGWSNGFPVRCRTEVTLTNHHKVTLSNPEKHVLTSGDTLGVFMASTSSTLLWSNVFKVQSPYSCVWKWGIPSGASPLFVPLGSDSSVCSSWTLDALARPIIVSYLFISFHIFSYLHLVLHTGSLYIKAWPI